MTAALEQPELVLDEETHIYYLNGVPVPNVTSIIEPLNNYVGIPKEVLDAKAKIGKYVHMATELYDQDNLDMNSVHENLHGYVQAWIKFRNESGFEIETMEQIVYHPVYGYTGTNDRVGKLNRVRSMLDIKTTAVLSPSVGCQTAAYAEAENQYRADGNKIIKRFGIQLRPDSSYRIQEYKDRSDFSVFLSCLQLLNWRKKHGYTG